MQKIALYINGKEVDIAEELHIPFTYTVEDITTPTAVKNNFSKTVKLEGTNRNNQIFSDLWNVQAEDVDFSLTRKNDFKLYLNGEIVESGYCKLDKILRNGRDITEYQLTLFGGLGDFFYNLSATPEGEKRTLADLKYTSLGDTEFDFLLTKEQIQYAWRALDGAVIPLDSIWRHINFAPCYNGIPENIDTTKTLYDIENNPFGIQGLPTGPSDANGVFLAQMKGEKKYDEWAAGDLRCYNQRPVIRVKSILNAIAQPKNNGGYTVNYDRSWFHTANPYYEKSWMTLPLLSSTDMEVRYDLQSVLIPTTTLTQGDNVFPIGFTHQIEALAKGRVEADYSFGIPNPENFPYAFNTYRHIQNFEEKYFLSCYVAQLVVRNGAGKYVYGSDIQVFSNNMLGYKIEELGYVPKVPANAVYFKEKFENNKGTLSSRNHTLTIDNIVLQSDLKFELHIQKLIKHNLDTVPAFDTLYRGKRPVENITDYMAELQLHQPNNMNRMTGGTLRQSRQVKNLFTKKRMLTTDYTPLDWLLSFAKMFNLYFIKDPETKAINVMTRNTFYSQLNDIENIEPLIDRSKPYTVKPIIFDRKWYEFRQKDAEGAYAEKYRKSTGGDFGVKRIDTGYDYDNGTKNLLSKSIFRTAVMVRKDDRSKSIWMYRTDWLKVPQTIPSMMWDGAEFWRYTYNAENEKIETEENAVGVLSEGFSSKYPENNTAKGIASGRIPLMWFAEADGKPTDGANILCFYNTTVPTHAANYPDIPASLRLTDDTPEMKTLNGEPCWLFSNDTSKALMVDRLPVFGRYYVGDGKSVKSSFNIGNPEITYTGDYYFNSYSSIYTKFWKTLINDQYDRNTREVECSVLMKERVMKDYLRKIFYFDGCYWILLEVKDYDITGNTPTKCRFLKVQDINNYRNGQQYDRLPQVMTVEEF